MRIDLAKVFYRFNLCGTIVLSGNEVNRYNLTGIIGRNVSIVRLKNRNLIVRLKEPVEPELFNLFQQLGMSKISVSCNGRLNWSLKMTDWQIWQDKLFEIMIREVTSQVA